jgi:hydroxyacylglutathione hydrolase
MAVEISYPSLKLLCFYSLENFSNTYILGPRDGGNAIVIDPGVFHAPILKSLEKWHWEIKHILITRQAQAHIRGLNTILKIFPADIYAKSKSVHGIKCHELHPNHPLHLDNLNIGVIHFPELSHDSVMFWIYRMLFSGDVLYAGSVGQNFNDSSLERIINALQHRLLDQAEDLTIYPGEGPPTTLKAEREFNRWLKGQPPARPARFFL